MTHVRNLLLAVGAAMLATGSNIAVADQPPMAVASIKPIHSLLAGVMEGAGEPALLVQGGASPHTFTLRPSDARLLAQADLLVWVGEGLESFLVQPIRALSSDAYLLELGRAEGITLLRMREGGAWEAHGHGATDEDEHGHDENGSAEGHGEGDDDHEEDHETAHAEPADEDGERHDDDGHHDDDEHHDDDAHVHEEDGHEHHAGEYNLHLWLDPANAAVIVDAMAGALSRLDAERATVYQANAATLKTRLQALDDELKEAFAPVSDRGFVVFHDAWQYLDVRYGLRAVGSVTVSPDQAPGAARVAEIRDKLLELDTGCVFAEPQFKPRLVHSLVTGTGAATGILDPLGAEIEDGPEMYFTLMRRNATAFRACFGQ